MRGFKIVCDFCGREVETRRRIDVSEYGPNATEPRYGKTYNRISRFDICDNCFEDFLEWRMRYIKQ